MRYRLVLIAEFDVGEAQLPESEALRQLDAFREAVQPSAEYGVVLYRATPEEIIFDTKRAWVACTQPPV